MTNKLFSLLLLILLILGIGIFVLPQRETSSLENRELATNKDIDINNLTNSVESVLSDQMYLRDEMTKLYYKLDVCFSKPFGSSFVNDVQLTYLSDDVIEIGDGYLINKIVNYDDDSLYMASSRGYNIDEMASKYPDIKTYVYFPTRIEELLNESSGYEPLFREYFCRQLGDNISYDKLEINDINKHKEYYYKTDMHWNNKGAYQGYIDIINMIGKDFDLGEVKVPVKEIEYNYEFRGNVSSQIGKVSDYDCLCDYEFDLEEYKYYINGTESNINEVKKEYAKNGNTSQYSDYEYYFGDNAYMRLFDFKNEEKPNILIFADSYINTNMSWIASHFNKTLIIDLRANNGEFNLNDTIKEYSIDAILITMRYTNLYLNGNMYIPLD